MNTLSLLQGLRYLDSFFPSGGFAFSSGLEAAVQGGRVSTQEELRRYLEEWLRFGLASRDAVAVARSHEAINTAPYALVIETDWELDALKLGCSSRAASRQMGRQFVRHVVADADAGTLLGRYAGAVEVNETPGHLAVCLGLTLGSKGWSRDETVAAFFYQSVVGMVSAALKLIAMGQGSGQRVIAQCLPIIDEVRQSVTPDQTMTGWTPLHDIYAMRHAYLEHRLFRS